MRSSAACDDGDGDDDDVEDASLTASLLLLCSVHQRDKMNGGEDELQGG